MSRVRYAFWAELVINSAVAWRLLCNMSWFHCSISTSILFGFLGSWWPTFRKVSHEMHSLLTCSFLLRSANSSSFPSIAQVSWTKSFWLAEPHSMEKPKNKGRGINWSGKMVMKRGGVRNALCAFMINDLRFVCIRLSFIDVSLPVPHQQFPLAHRKKKMIPTATQNQIKLHGKLPWRGMDFPDEGRVFAWIFSIQWFGF